MNSNNILTTKTKVVATMTAIFSAPMSLFNVTRLPVMYFSRRAKVAIISLFLLLGVTAAQAGTELYFVHGDHLGTAKLITNQNQDVVWQADYTPFGEVVETSNQTEYRLRFPGQYQDDETGFYYNYYRDYDPSLGRYIQSDPIGLDDGPNTYTYVYGNPLNYYDSDGLNARRANITSPFQSLTNTQATALINQIRRIDPTFSYPVASPARPGQSTSYSQTSVRQLQKILNNAQNSQSCGPSATNHSLAGSSSVQINVLAPYSPTSLYGRSFSQHALQRTHGRGIPPSVVNNTILYGRSSLGNQPNTTKYSGGGNNVTVIVNSVTGNVITVRYGK